MNKKLLKRFFPLIAILLLAPWPVAYAYNNDANAAAQETVQIEVAEPSAAPTWTVFGSAIGGVAPGDLFYINASENPADITATLYITNASELIKSYRYLILKVRVYVQSGDGEWQIATAANDEPIPDTCITLKNGRVSFSLQGYARYRLTIDSGSFNARAAGASGGSAAPQFYLTTE